jgi:hypothetical protein
MSLFSQALAQFHPSQGGDTADLRAFLKALTVAYPNGVTPVDSIASVKSVLADLGNDSDLVVRATATIEGLRSAKNA